ncbi:MAG: hypothetical protein GY742_13540 [Hyphomicrobiales bacterium]|nr:hypothetical protein [Hyphomicrobiales bacterium]
MVTTPRPKNTRRKTPSRAKKPATIDLEAVEVTEKAEAVPKAEKEAAGDKKEPPKTAASTAQKPTTVPASGSRPPRSSQAKSQAKAEQKPVDPKPATAKTAKPTVSSEPAKKPETDPAKSGSDFGKLAIAGFVGGVITLGGAGLMQYAGLLPSASGDNPPPAAPVVPVVDLAPLQTKIAELQNKIDNQPAVEVPAIDLSPIKTRIETLEGALQTALDNSGSSPDTSLQIADQLNTVKTELENLKTSSDQLAARLDDLAATASNTTPSTEQVEAITAPLISPLVEATDQNSEKIARLEKEIAAIAARIDEDLVSRIDQFGEKLKNAATGEKLARSVAVNALKSALDNGDPFSAALASVETLTGSSDALELLKPHASAGIPTAKSLLREFHDLQGNLLLAASSDGDAGLSDRLMLSIKSLVTVSSDQPLAGNSPEAVISRIEVNLKKANLEQALAEWSSLPDPAQKVSQAWAEKLKRRNNADNQMLDLLKSIQASG